MTFIRGPIGADVRRDRALFSGDADFGDYGPDRASSYTTWVSQVRALGGRATVLPARGNVASPAAAAFDDVALWVRKVNAKEWRLPDAYSRSGRTAFYVAPARVQADAKRLAEAKLREHIVPSTKEVVTETAKDIAALPRKAVGEILGIPPWAVTAAIGVGVFFLAKQLLPVAGAAARSRFVRRNPRGRRRARRRARQ